MPAAVATLALGVVVGVMGAGFGANGINVGDGGVLGGEVSCTISDVQPEAGPVMCAEATGLSAAEVTQFMANCTGVNPVDAGSGGMAVYADGPCSRTNAVGGCRLTAAGQTATLWHYVGFGGAEADSRSNCAAAGGTYVVP